MISKAITEFDEEGRIEGTGKVVMPVRVDTHQDRAADSFCCIFPANVAFPVSSMVAFEFCIVFPHVQSILTIALSVELAAPTTFPAPAEIARLSA